MYLPSESIVKRKFSILYCWKPNAEQCHIFENFQFKAGYSTYALEN